ncbi:MAG: pseudouridine synthase [Patescibacteria group bacterium]|mgnify:CR=1 FL=1
MRLHKFIASTGIVSRRKAEVLISEGKVFVNELQVAKLGTSIDPEKDTVRVDGVDLQQPTTFRYIAVNKPVGVVSTRAQYKNERTIYDILPGMRDLVIAGRLDKDSEGLMLLTNDGALANELTHPRYQHEKEYEIGTSHHLNAEALAELRQGVKLQEGRAYFDKLEEVGTRTYRVVLHQGWKRQIRRMFGRVHVDVVRLTRVRMHRLLLGTLAPGESRAVTREEIL